MSQVKPYPDAIIEAISLFNVLRTLGFRREEMIVNFAFLPSVRVGIMAQDLPLFVTEAGIWADAPANPQEVWEQACTDWNSDDPHSVEVWRMIFESTDTCRRAWTFTRTLMAPRCANCLTSYWIPDKKREAPRCPKCRATVKVAGFELRRPTIYASHEGLEEKPARIDLLGKGN